MGAVWQASSQDTCCPAGRNMVPWQDTFEMPDSFVRTPGPGIDFLLTPMSHDKLALIQVRYPNSEHCENVV